MLLAKYFSNLKLSKMSLLLKSKYTDLLYLYGNNLVLINLLCTGHISRQSHREKYPVVSREMPKHWMRVDWGD